MIIQTKDVQKIKKIFKDFVLPKENSHKGQNGRLLIIGGSSLFHSASLWAAEVASHFVDIVHYYSTKENQQIFINLKTKFRNGIIISRKDILDYVKEDEAILIGSGMVRDFERKNLIKNRQINDFKDIFSIKNEGEYTYFLTKYLIENFPEKKFVFDAGALQMLEKDWLLKLKTQAILTPHQKEFEDLFEKKIINLSLEEKIRLVKFFAKKYKVTILLKAIQDIISDGNNTYIIKGGNQGLTKGGTGDLLAGLTASFYCKNNSVLSAILASFLLKKAADELYKKFKYWYNIDKLLEVIPGIFAQL